MRQNIDMNRGGVSRQSPREDGAQYADGCSSRSTQPVARLEIVRSSNSVAFRPTTQATNPNASAYFGPLSERDSAS